MRHPSQNPRPALVLLPLLVALCACHNFEVQTPPQFLALEEDGGGEGYAYRATSADGVVLAIREIRNEPYGDQAFWADAIRARLRLAKGYALLEEKKIRAQSGQEGVQMRFGREEHGKPYLYDVTLFVTEAHVFALETGGRKERVVARAKNLAQAVASFAIR